VEERRGIDIAEGVGGGREIVWRGEGHRDSAGSGGA